MTASARRAKLSDRRSVQVEAEARGRQDGVEGAAIADVAENAASAGKIDGRVERGGEGGHAVERDAGAAIRDMHSDRAARAFQDEVGGAIAQRDAAGGDRPAAKRDRGVAAHGAEAGVVHEQHAERGGRGGGDDERAIHLGVAARFQHEAAAMEVEAGGGVMALFQDAGAAGLGEAFEDEPHRLAAGVHFDGAVGGDGGDGKVGHAGGVAGAGFVDNAPGLDLEARFARRGAREAKGDGL